MSTIQSICPVRSQPVIIVYSKKKSVIYRQLPLVYLLKLVESLDTLFRLQDIKVQLKTAMTGRQQVALDHT